MKEGWKKIATQVKEKTQCIGKTHLIFSCHCLWKDALYIIIYTLKMMHLSNKNLLIVCTGCSTEQRPQTTLKEPQESLSKYARISNFHFLSFLKNRFYSIFLPFYPSIYPTFFFLSTSTSFLALFLSPVLLWKHHKSHDHSPALTFLTIHLLTIPASLLPHRIAPQSVISYSKRRLMFSKSLFQPPRVKGNLVLGEITCEELSAFLN